MCWNCLSSNEQPNANTPPHAPYTTQQGAGPPLGGHVYVLNKKIFVAWQESTVDNTKF